jgi:hypothetical protein
VPCPPPFGWAVKFFYAKFLPDGGVTTLRMEFLRWQQYWRRQTTDTAKPVMYCSRDQARSQGGGAKGGQCLNCRGGVGGGTPSCLPNPPNMMPWDTLGGQFQPPAVVNDAESPVCNGNDNE